MHLNIKVLSASSTTLFMVYSWVSFFCFVFLFICCYFLEGTWEPSGGSEDFLILLSENSLMIVKTRQKSVEDCYLQGFSCFLPEWQQGFARLSPWHCSCSGTTVERKEQALLFQQGRHILTCFYFQGCFSPNPNFRPAPCTSLQDGKNKWSLHQLERSTWSWLGEAYSSWEAQQKIHHLSPSLKHYPSPSAKADGKGEGESMSAFANFTKGHKRLL